MRESGFLKDCYLELPVLEKMFIFGDIFEKNSFHRKIFCSVWRNYSTSSPSGNLVDGSPLVIHNTKPR